MLHLRSMDERPATSQTRCTETRCGEARKPPRSHSSLSSSWWGSAGAAGASVSAPGFKAPREFDTSAKGTSSVARGDLNGDGKLDVVATDGAFDDDPPALKRLRLVSVLYGRGER